MKRGIFQVCLLIFSLILLVGVVSASYGNYYSSGLSDFLNSIDSSTAVIVVVFILSFLILNFSLMKFFKEKTWAGVAAFALSFFVVYGLNKSGVNYDNIFYYFGFSEEAIFWIILLSLAVGSIYVWAKFGISKVLLVLGGISIIAAAFEWVYNQGVFFLLGGILVFFGLIFLFIETRKGKGKTKSFKFDLG